MVANTAVGSAARSAPVSAAGRGGRGRMSPSTGSPGPGTNTYRAFSFRAATPPATLQLSGTQELYWMCLDEQNPLHPRRTLDQYYYHTLDDAKKRGDNPTASRYFNKKKPDGSSREGAETLTMVDQPWMWVLPGCENSPSTVITAFTQRSNRITRHRTKCTTLLMDSIMRRYKQVTPKAQL